MSPIHVSPAEAVKIHQELNPRQSIATHFGTFPLADDSLEEPLTGLQEALKKNGVPASEFIIPQEGAGIEF